MKLPRDVSGPELVKALHKLGYQVDRQRGSHVRVTTRTWDADGHQLTETEHSAAHGAVTHRTAHDHVPVVNHRSRLLSRHERAIGAVRAVGKALSRRTKARAVPGGDDLRTRQAKENQRPVDQGSAASNRIGERCIADRHVEERTVGLDVLQPHAQPCGNGGERPNLVSHEILDIAWRELQLSPTEALWIGKSRMGPHRNAVVASELHRRSHHAGIARVESARHVRGGDVRDQGQIWACGPRDGLADVRVQIDPHRHALCNSCVIPASELT